MNTPPKPTGSSQFDRFCVWVWESITIRLRLVDIPGLTWQYTSKGIIPKFTRVTGGGIKDDWANPIVYDKTKSYKKGQFVVIRPTDSIVTAGATDYGTATNKKSIGGVWKATQDVAPVSVEGPDQYHVPRWPLPAADDPDNILTFWMLMSLYPVTTADCSGSTSYLANAQKPS